MKHESLIRIPGYPHFDALIERSAAEKLVSSISAISSHSFLPLLSYEKRWIPFSKRHQPDPDKVRIIRYAARRDSYIFSAYRAKLEPLYESQLASRGLSNVVLAYRKIPIGNGKNKSNIQFARDAFNLIRQMKAGSAVCLDIKGFFDSLDHLRLKNVWLQMLGLKHLPTDHYAVFKAVTSFAYVDRHEAFLKLGIIGPKKNKHGNNTIGYTVARQDMSKQFCSPREYREKIRPLIKRNDAGHGIPQGVPMSDLLSNMYLLDFDEHVNGLVGALGGHYLRYSDDLLLILPEDADPIDVRDKVIGLLSATGPQMLIQPNKCSVHVFAPKADSTLCIDHAAQPSSCSSVEYLGYAFDGKRVLIRNSTLARLHRRITLTMRRHIRQLREASPKSNRHEFESLVNHGLVHSRYGRKPPERDGSTFFSYAKRSHETHSDFDSLTIKQLDRLRRFVKRRAKKEIDYIFP